MVSPDTWALDLGDLTLRPIYAPCTHRLHMAQGVAPRVSWRLSSRGWMSVMGAPREYSLKLKERATRMAVEARLDLGGWCSDG